MFPKKIGDLSQASMFTFPKTNSEWKPLKLGPIATRKERIVFQPSIFSGKLLVLGRVGLICNFFLVHSEKQIQLKIKGNMPFMFLKLRLWYHAMETKLPETDS